MDLKSKHIMSLDLETLGTNVDSQIIQIGWCVYDLANHAHLEHGKYDIHLDPNEPVNATVGTMKFWRTQPDENLPECLKLEPDLLKMTSLEDALGHLINTYSVYECGALVALGTKFDNTMVEYRLKEYALPIPWVHNADFCLRPLRSLAETIDPSMHAVACEYADNMLTAFPKIGSHHDAECDAVWQAFYLDRFLSLVESGLCPNKNKK